MKHPFALSLIGAACAALLATACGGGGGNTADTSTPPSSTVSSPAPSSNAATTSGTVTGFGSVIVDGIRIDDHAVTPATEQDDGSMKPAELKIGQHVEVDHDANMVAVAVRIVDEVEGTVDAVDATAGTLTVVGQKVVVNTDASAGPVTVFEAPYTGLADIKQGDSIEVHGLIKTDASGAAYVQATRIEQRVADGFNRVRGLVKDLAAGQSTFKLGDLTIDYSGAKLLPAGESLANGEEVHVSIPVGNTTAGGTVKAKVIKITDHKKNDHGKSAELGGAISAIDATAKTMTINGVTVDISSASFLQTGKSMADLQVNTYVVVKGTYNDQGVLVAAKIVIRGVGDADSGGEAELHGTILNYTSNASFTVRDVKVDASNATIDAASCGGSAQLANNMQVEVEGQLTSAGVVNATSVKCEQSDAGHVEIVGRDGQASKVDTTGMTFTLTTEKGTVNVQWSTSTLFVNIDASKLDSAQIEVEGTLSADGTLHATKIELKTAS